MSEKDINKPQEDDDNVTVVVEGEDTADTAEPPKDSEGAQNDEPLSSSAEDDEDDEDDSHGEDAKERRRLTRSQRNAKRREKFEQLRREIEARDSVINNLRSEVDAINRRNNSGDLARLEEGLREAAQAHEYFKGMAAQAVEQANGKLHADALEKMSLARDKFNELSRIKTAYARQQQRPQPLDPRLVTNASEWMRNKPWYDQTGKDPDSRIVVVLDDMVANEGYDPTTPAYWKELDRRIEKYLPHRVKVGHNGGQSGSTRSSPVAGADRGGSPSGKNTFVLSADRVQAMKEAGLWDDPAKRDAAIKQYRAYDRANGTN